MSYYSAIIEGDSRNYLSGLALTWYELISVPNLKVNTSE